MLDAGTALSAALRRAARTWMGTQTTHPAIRLLPGSGWLLCVNSFFPLHFLFIWNSLTRERTSQAGQILDVCIVLAPKCVAKIVFLLKKNLQLTGFNSFLTF
jgi:hypothetical protein